MDEEQDKYIASSVSAFVQNGEIYAVPKVVETLILIYNKSVLRNPFDTLDEYLDYSKKIVSQGNNEYGLLVYSEPDEGTKIVIHIPAIPFTEENRQQLEAQSYRNGRATDETR